MKYDVIVAIDIIFFTSYIQVNMVHWSKAYYYCQGSATNPPNFGEIFSL